MNINMENMSRDELKMMLFGWLQSKGILLELQAFLRSKMVEKLHESKMMNPGSGQSLSDEDRARDLIVCDYLRRRRMPYTLSVFASESGCSTEDLNLDEGPLRSRIGRTLSLKLDGARCVLDTLADVCGETQRRRRRAQSRSCQTDEPQSPTRPTKLTINSRTQTDPPTAAEEAVIGGAAPTTTTAAAATQPGRRRASGEEQEEQEAQLEELRREVRRLRVESDEQRSALQTCRLQLRQAVERQMAAELAERSARINWPLAVGRPSPSGRAEHFEKRIEQAKTFLGDLDDRLVDLDVRHQRVLQGGRPKSPSETTREDH